MTKGRMSSASPQKLPGGTHDVSDHVVCLKVAVIRMHVRLVQVTPQYSSDTHNRVSWSRPMTSKSGSFTIPNIGTTSSYSFWLMNSTMYRM